MLIDKALDYRQTVQALASAVLVSRTIIDADVESDAEEVAEQIATALGRAGYALVRTTEDNPIKEQAADWFGREEDA